MKTKRKTKDIYRMTTRHASHTRRKFSSDTAIQVWSGDIASPVEIATSKLWGGREHTSWNCMCAQWLQGRVFAARFVCLRWCFLSCLFIYLFITLNFKIGLKLEDLANCLFIYLYIFYIEFWNRFAIGGFNQ